MNAIERLRRDHETLRAKLSVLESALRMGPEAWFVLREVCYTLGRQLRDHIRREESLVAACRKTVSPETLQHLALEHRDEPTLLRTLNRLFVQEHGQAWEDVTVILAQLIHGLRRHLQEEEMELFPQLERFLSSQSASLAFEQRSCVCNIQDTMTLNRLVREYPQARRIFDDLFISLPFEGCDCLDEVAWRHGMESGELLAKLEQAIQSHPEVTQQPTAREDTCESCDTQQVGGDIHADAGSARS